MKSLYGRSRASASRMGLGTANWKEDRGKEKRLGTGQAGESERKKRETQHGE